MELNGTITENRVDLDGTISAKKTLSGSLSRPGRPITVDDALSDTSENPVQNKVVTAALGNKLSTTGDAYRSASIPMGHLDSTSTATVMTAQVDGITELRDGVCMWLRNGVITSASGFTLNVNGLGAKPCYSSAAAASRSTTIFNVNYTMLFVYNEDRVDGGCWDIVYGVDTNTTYTPPKLGFGYGTCTTAAATVAKIASISSYTLVAGGIVAIKFDNDVPAGATLNISSKGAKAIYYKGASITAGVIKAGDTVTMIYSTYYHVLSIDRGGSDITIDNALSTTSENPVQNKVVKAALDGKGTYSKPSGGIPASDLASGVIPTVPTKTSDLTNDSGFVNAAGAAAAAPVKSVNGQTGAVTVQAATDAQVSTAVNTWCGNNVAQETGYVLDSTLTMSNAAAPADKVGELKSALDSLNELCRDESTAITENSFAVTQGVTIGTNVHILDISIPTGTDFKFELSDPNNCLANCTLYANGQLFHNGLQRNVVHSFTADRDITYFSIYVGAASVVASGTLTARVTIESTNPDSLESRVNSLETEVEKTSDIVETTEHNPANWLNPQNITSGYYWSGYNGADYTDGYSESTSYWNTGLIPVDAGKTYSAQYGSELAASGSRRLCIPRWLMMYDENKKVVSSACVNGPSTAPFTVPSGIAYVILSISTAYGPAPYNSFNEGSTVIDFTEYFDPYTETTIKDSYIPDIPVKKIENILPVLSIVGDDCLVSKSASLSANASIELTNAPRYIKKNVGLSFWGNLSNFASLTIGKGFESYRGKWIVIDGTSVNLYTYESATTLVETVTFDLSVSDYISVNMYMTASGIIKISINSVADLFETEFDVSNEWNGIPFVKVGQAMTNVELSCAFADLRKPLWIFGDSYYGLQKNRVSGQLKQLGFFDGVLVDSIAGQASFTGSDTAFAELERMLEFATPKFLVWDLGINGVEIESIAGLDDLQEVCNSKGITLILCLIPSVPNYNRDALNNAIRNSGERYADIEAAVGANSSGVWYSGFLSDDNVHPTENGAKAIAMKLLADVPEIMMYGYSPSSADGTSSGDASNLGN